MIDTYIHRKLDGRHEQLKKITCGRGLGDAYGVTLARFKGKSGGNSRLGMAALMWISRSERLMSPDELYHALDVLVQIGSINLYSEKIPSIQTLLASDLGLVTINKNRPSAW